MFFILDTFSFLIIHVISAYLAIVAIYEISTILDMSVFLDINSIYLMFDIPNFYGPLRIVEITLISQMATYQEW